MIVASVIVPRPRPNATQLGYGHPQIYRIAGNFHKIQIFAIFTTHDQIERQWASY